MEKYKTMNYSGEFSILKKLHEKKTGRNFSDEEFNEIFQVALKTTPRLSSIADKFQSDTITLLVLFAEATREWESEKVSADMNAGGNVMELISDLEMVIDYYSNEINSNWSSAGILASIHESLGLQLDDTYDKHVGYSRTAEEGVKRHSTASKELLKKISAKVDALQRKSQFGDLARWRKFFTDLLEIFQDILPKVKSKAAMKKDEKFYHHTMMAGYYEIQEKKLWNTIADFNSSSDQDLRKAAKSMEKEGKKMSFRVEFHEREKKKLYNSKIHGHWNDTIPTEEEARNYGESFLNLLETNTPAKPKSLREEAIELAKKLKDEQLVKYLKTAPMRMVQKRIPALRIAALKMEKGSKPQKLSKLEQKKFDKTYKYTSDNRNVIKSGTRVLDENGYERVIEEVSDKTLKLEGDNGWIHISEVKFKS